MAEENSDFEILLPAGYHYDGNGNVMQEDIYDLPGDNPNQPQMGWIVNAEVGMVIINDGAIQNANILGGPEENSPKKNSPKENKSIDSSHLFEDSEDRFKLMDI